MRQVQEIQRDTLWLSLLEQPWSEARGLVRQEMTRLGMTVDDLYFAVHSGGLATSRNTLSRYLRGEGEPKFDALRAIVGALVDNSPTARFLSSSELTYALRPSAALGGSGVHDAHDGAPILGRQALYPGFETFSLDHIPQAGDVNQLAPIRAAV